VMNMLVGVLVQARPFLFIDEPWVVEGNWETRFQKGFFDGI
jgi:hypothetical protein